VGDGATSTRRVGSGAPESKPDKPSRVGGPHKERFGEPPLAHSQRNVCQKGGRFGKKQVDFVKHTKREIVPSNTKKTANTDRKEENVKVVHCNLQEE